ncbi:peptidase [Pseudomonas sp. CFBP 8772]|uniref:peptidase n=1 Tax=Pseudomonas sp. CFBP 8772 TaxID=2775284 RepID=UPI0017832A2C|nr:peptidase [Pseudomonas sp. CFBP 8772]MBD8600988.1 peptidase [Pseudomonas sp. CFBP 8772]
MPSRRDFLILSAGTGALIAIGLTACTQKNVGHVQSATTVTKVFGDGIRLIAVAVEYPTPVKNADLSAADFKVEGRTVTGVFASTSTDPGDRAEAGRFAIVTLSPKDADAVLAKKLQPPQASDGGQSKPAQDTHGPGNAGNIPTYDTVYKPARATLIAPGVGTLTTTTARNLVVDDFRQLEFNDPHTGKTLRYNLFVPKNYDPGTSYPLVLFMHDAGATSDITRTTLLQGLGAIAWASPDDQSKRPAFVLAPQFAEIIADDDSHTSDALDTTIDLIKALSDEYSIDRNRLYATGQSGGCMMSIAMDIKYPNFFAATFLVAGQWDPVRVKPLVSQKLWILVSQDDDKAFPGQNVLTQALEQEGAKISRASWDGTWTAEQFRAAFDKIDAQDSPINYVTFAKGTVIPKEDSGSGASGHRNTWRIAYTIEPIREWIFRQRK